MRKLILEIDISEEAFELLKSMKYKDSLEYRDSEFDNLEKFKNSTLFFEGLREEDWFLERNAGGTLYLIHELRKYNLVENNFDSWHQTYHITELGKKFVEQNS